MAAIDLNSDVGEGFGDDAQLLEIVTSANVACGFHAGDASIMRRTCEIAARRGVRVGAQVSYPDREGFGRRFIDMDPAALADAVVYQVGALEACARASGLPVTYVKPHGALYNAAVHHEAQARAVVDGVRAVSDALVVVGLPGSALLRCAGQAGLRTCDESFADRAYLPDGRLVPRDEMGAVIHDRDTVVARVLHLIDTGTMLAIDGSPVAVGRDSVCVHGDTPGAVDIARAVRSALDGAGVAVAAFT